MEKVFFKPLYFFVFIILLTAGCQKEANLVNSEQEHQSLLGRAKNGCRLTNLTALGGYYNFSYNSAGLAHEWEISDYGLFRQEYDANGRLVISRLYADEELVYTVHFIYDHNKVVREIWYAGNTGVIDDDIYYTYNNMGLIERGESFIKDYYTINMFTPEGNTASFIFYEGGLPVFSASLTYEDKVKNPYIAVPGIPYAFPFANPTYFTNKWWASSERVVFYDENGAEIVDFDYDASQTVWEMGHQHYPMSTTYFDRISSSLVPYTFEYENCVPGSNNPQRSSAARPSTTAARINPLGIIKRGSSKTIRQQVEEFRKTLSQ